MTTPEYVADLIGQCWDAPHGIAQIALAEEAIAQADALGDDELRFDARMVATTAYQYGGEPGKGFVTFSWCLTQYDRDPERFGPQEHLLLWYFKYMINSLTRFPEIPLDRTYAVLDDMQRRYAGGGHSLQAVHKNRWLVASHIGDVAAADEFYERWQSSPRDSNSDCRGCDPTDQVIHLADRGRDTEAIALTEPVLSGRLTCSEQPQSIQTTLLLPYLRTGRLDEARSAYHSAYRAVRANPAEIATIASHLRFLVASGNATHALELVERHLPWLEKSPTPHAEMRFSAAVSLVLRHLCEQGQSDRQILGTGKTAAVLRDELAARATALAARFDARNGSGEQGDRIRQLLATEEIAQVPLSLSVRLGEQVLGTPKKRKAPEVAVLDDVPASADLDLLLDLAEDALWRDNSPRVEALWLRVEQAKDIELSVLQQARIADLAGMRLHDADSAELIRVWTQAQELYSRAGDQVREQRTRGRLGLHLCRHGESEFGLAEVRATTAYLVEFGAPRDKTGALRRLGVALLHAGEPAEAVSVLDQLDGIDEPDPGARVRLQGMMIRAQALGADGQADAALETAAELLAGAQEAQDNELCGLAEFIVGQSYLLLEDGNAAVQAFDRALAHDGLPAELIREVKERRAMLLAGTSRAAEAVTDLAGLVARLVADAQQEEADYARFQLAVALFNADRAGDGAEVAEEALYGADRAGNQGLADQVRHLLAAIYQRLDDPDQALSHLDKLAENLNGFDNTAGRAHVLEQAGDLLFDLDKDLQAAQRFEAAAACYEIAGATLEWIRALRRQAVATMFGVGAEAAQEVLAKADVAAASLVDPELDVQYELAWLQLDGARVLAGTGDADAALTRITPVPELFRQLESYGEAFLAELTMGEVLLTVGRPAEAEPVLRGVVGGLPRDAGTLPRAAYALAHALLQQEKTEEARKIARHFRIELD
jgi:tetratricopeptide (TPR) repeat protein